MSPATVYISWVYISVYTIHVTYVLRSKFSLSPNSVSAGVCSFDIFFVFFLGESCSPPSLLCFMPTLYLSWCICLRWQFHPLFICVFWLLCCLVIFYVSLCVFVVCLILTRFLSCLLITSRFLLFFAGSDSWFPRLHRFIPACILCCICAIWFKVVDAFLAAYGLHIGLVFVTFGVFLLTNASIFLYFILGCN